MNHIATTHTPTLTHAGIMGLPNSKPHQRKKNEWRSACPFCESEHQFLYWPDAGNYWCRSCDAKGFVDGAAILDPARLAEVQAQQERRERKDREDKANAVERIKGMRSVADFYHSNVDYNFWQSKGVKAETVDRFNLGSRQPDAGDYAWRRETASHSIPYYLDGELVGIRHRLATDIGGKYRPEFGGLPSQLFNPDRLGRRNSTMQAGEAVLVEGEIKAIVLDQEGLRVMAIPGKSHALPLAEDIRTACKTHGINRLFITLDPDATNEARGLAVELGPLAIVSQLPGKPDDLLVFEGWTVEKLYKSLAPKLMATRERRDSILAEGKQRRAARLAEAIDRQAELERRYLAGDVIAFLGDEVDPDYIEYRREHFSDAKGWRDYVAEHWPDVDADQQHKIKLAENREARPDKCGDYRKFVLPNGLTITRRWTCGMCDECIKRGVWIYNRALDELYGIPHYDQESFVPLDDLTGDTIPGDDAPRENAPPLPAVKGDLSLLNVATNEERVKLARDLRRAGVNYRTQPLVWNGDTVFDFLINDDRGDPARLMLTDERLAAWVQGAENKRASGGLLPSLKKLQKRYRPALPYEVVMPELDDEGEPVDPDIFALDLPDVGTTAKLPDIAIDYPVHDRDRLQTALIEINNQQHRILGRRGDVNYGVYSKKKFYTRYSTLDRLIEDFNTWQAQIRCKKGLPDLE